MCPPAPPPAPPPVPPFAPPPAVPPAPAPPNVCFCCVCVAVLNYENVVETGSETDEDSILATGGGAGGEGEREDEELGSPADVPTLEASPRVAHALLSSEGSEIREGLQNLHNCWRLGDTDGHLNGSGESSHDLTLTCSF